MDDGSALTAQERSIAKQLELDLQVLASIKEITNCGLYLEEPHFIHPMSDIELQGFRTALIGGGPPERQRFQKVSESSLKYLIEPRDYPRAILEVRSRIKPLTTFAIEHRYHFANLPLERHVSDEFKSVAIVLRDYDQFDFLELYSGKGWVFKDDIPTFKKWDDKFGFDLIGVSRDRVDFVINKVGSKHVEELFEEMVEVCSSAGEFGGKDRIIHALRCSAMISLEWF